MSKPRKNALFAAAAAVAAAGAVLTVTHIAVAQPPADATYSGSKLCVVCHKATHKELVEAFEKTAHPKALLKASDPGAIVADFGEDCPVNRPDIHMVLGVGKRSQAYIGKDGKTLPGKWFVNEKRWKPLQVVDATTQCVPCHVTGYDAAKKSYNEAGVQCEACHGPGSAHATTGDKTKIGQISALPFDRQAMICGQCHSEGVSVKDPSFKHPVGMKWGDDLKDFLKLAEVKGPGMNQQYNEWLLSKHAVSQVGCTTCHEVHGKGSENVAMLKKPQNALCMDCHADAVAKPSHPKVPEGVKCSLCHMPQGMHTFKMAQ